MKGQRSEHRKSGATTSPLITKSCGRALDPRAWPVASYKYMGSGLLQLQARTGKGTASSSMIHVSHHHTRKARNGLGKYISELYTSITSPAFLSYHDVKSMLILF